MAIGVCTSYKIPDIADLTVEDLLKLLVQASGAEFTNDQALLG